MEDGDHRSINRDRIDGSFNIDMTEDDFGTVGKNKTVEENQYSAG